MNKQAITDLVQTYISQSMQGMEVENPKFDFKSKWYDLKNPISISEFLKDTSAIANTFGPDGFLVIGFDDRSKQFHEVRFSDSGLKDSSAIPDIISRYVDRQFTINYYEVSIDNNILGLLHIPPSIDKPHVIRSYKSGREQNIREEQHKIFIRKGTQTFPATKYDLELMYYDRKNILPEYELYASLHKDSFVRAPILRATESAIAITLSLNVENTGRRPLSIIGVDFKLAEFKDSSEHEMLLFADAGDLKYTPMIVAPQTMVCQSIRFVTKKIYDYFDGEEVFDSYKHNLHRLGISEIKLRLITGQTIKTDVSIIK